MKVTFTDAEKDLLIFCYIWDLPAADIPRYEIPIDLQRKLMTMKLQQGLDVGVGKACGNDIDWVLERCDDHISLCTVAYYHYVHNFDIFMRMLDIKLTAFLLTDDDIKDGDNWCKILYHPKVQATEEAWTYILRPAELEKLGGDILTIFSKVNFFAMVNLSDMQLLQIIAANKDAPHIRTLRRLLWLHYPSKISCPYENGFDPDVRFFKFFFPCLPRALQREIKTFKLVCVRLRKTICKNLEQLIVKKIVKLHVKL